MTRKILLAVTALVVVLAAAAVPAGAGRAMLQLSISPTTGDAGTVVTFTPEDACPNVNNNQDAATNAPGDSYAAIALVADPDPADFVADTVTDLDGFWSLTYTVPEDEPAGDITFYGFCLYENFPTQVTVAAVPDDSFITASYDPVVFTTTVPETTTTTSSTSTTSTTAAPAPTLVASPTSVLQGGTIAIDAKGFKPGSEVVVTLESDPVNLGTFVADSAGRIATSVVVPTDFPTGAHTLKLTGVGIAGSVLVLSTGINVASNIQVAPTTAPPAAAPATAATLPQTGSSMATTPALVIAAGLVLLGSVAVLAARRRRASTSR